MLHKFIQVDKFELEKLLAPLRDIQKYFLENYMVNDIWSNSKLYEIIIANKLGHKLIPGHSGSKDAKDDLGNIYEYKHYRESSSNHTWTFNDYSDTTIESLRSIKSVIFAHINDSRGTEVFDWYYDVPGNIMAEHLKQVTQRSTNTRKMWNVSHNQIEQLNISKTNTIIDSEKNGKYYEQLKKIFKIKKELEQLTSVSNILTSNKIWEVIVSAELGHSVNSEQGGRAGAHDAYDSEGNAYEYKVSKNHSWQFQDISENVLKKYLDDEEIILAVVDKTSIKLTALYSAKPGVVVKLLKKKLKEKRTRNPNLRRLQVSLTKGNLQIINANKVI